MIRWQTGRPSTCHVLVGGLELSAKPFAVKDGTGGQAGKKLRPKRAKRITVTSQLQPTCHVAIEVRRYELVQIQPAEQTRSDTACEAASAASQYRQTSPERITDG